MAARRGAWARVATGVEAFAWFPDGKRIAFVSWVWPELKGAKAQEKAFKAFKERKESGYVTSQAQYRHWDSHLPMGRVPHLLVMDVATGRVRDLFEGSHYELVRSDPDRHAFDISPDGQRIVFAFDTGRREARRQLLRAGRDRAEEPARARTGARCRLGHGRAALQPRGLERIAFLASHQGLKHTMPAQLCLWERDSGQWSVQSAEWDHEVHAPLHWEDDGQALLFMAEQKGRQHLWRFDLPDRRAEVVVQGGTRQRLRQARRHAGDAGRRGRAPGARARPPARRGAAPHRDLQRPRARRRATRAHRGALVHRARSATRCRCG